MGIVSSTAEHLVPVTFSVVAQPMSAAVTGFRDDAKSDVRTTDSVVLATPLAPASNHSTDNVDVL